MRAEQSASLGTIGSAVGGSRGAGGSSRASLHAKMVVMDERILVVGSMNLDLRSKLQNSEVALIIRSRPLSQEAARLRRSGKDEKWQRLSETLDLPDMFDANKNRRKLVLFTEHRDTLNYLAEKLADRLGNQNAVVVIHGGTPRERRRQVQESFENDPEVLVL